MQQNSLAQQTFVISYTRKTFAHKGKNKFLQRKTRVCSAVHTKKDLHQLLLEEHWIHIVHHQARILFLQATKLRCGHEGVHLWMWLPCLQKCNYLFFAGLMQNITTNTISCSHIKYWRKHNTETCEIILNFASECRRKQKKTPAANHSSECERQPVFKYAAHTPIICKIKMTSMTRLCLKTRQC